MQTTTKKIDFLKSCFGENHKITRDGKNIAFICPSCGDKNDLTKKKFSVCLDTLMCHCWVCNIRGKTPYKIIKDHRLDEKLGSRLSVFQELYRLDSSIMDDINDWNTFPELPKIITDENLIGYIIKFNVSEALYFKFNDKKPIIRLYEYKIIEANNYNKTELTPIIVYDRKYYVPS